MNSQPPESTRFEGASRRQFLAATSAAMVGSALARTSRAQPADATTGQSVSLAGRVYKSTKWGMIQAPGSVRDKFALMKSLGYDGMELESPIGLSAKEVRSASEATGMPVHGVVDMKHWGVRLSDPDSNVRDNGRAILEKCLSESASFGGDTVLLVPGRVSGENETHDHVWKRSIEEIRKALPTASRLGVRILIENVWNGFCTTPEELRDYLDEIDSPWVGSYFDIGNVQKFSPPAEWITTLGERIVKLDVKGWGIEAGFCKIGDGDVDWPAVRVALDKIGFTGWCTAEVGGGDKDRLADIADRVDRALGL